MHIHEITDSRGELIDVVPFCSDNCHRDYCDFMGVTYSGWNGCHDGPDYSEWCVMCGTIASCGEEACECQRENTLVNRFRVPYGELCQHGNYVQLPYIHPHLVGM